MIFLCNCDTDLLPLFLYHLEIDLFFDWFTRMLNDQEKNWVVELQCSSCMLQTLKKGDIIIGSVLTKSVSGMMLKVLCTDGEGAKCVSDVNVKVWELVFFYAKAVCCSGFSCKWEGISIWSTVMPVLRINWKILQTDVIFILTVVGIRSLSMYVLKCLKFILDSIFLAKNENYDCRLYSFVYNVHLRELNVIFGRFSLHLQGILCM